MLQYGGTPPGAPLKQGLTMKAITTLSLLAALAGTTALAQNIPQTDDDWIKAGQEAVASALAKQPITGKAKNVILFIADGNSIETNYMTRLWSGQQAGGYGDEYVQPQEAFPAIALVKTYNINAQTPDSAPTAAAMNSGVKQRFNVINVGQNATAEDCNSEAGNELKLFSEYMTEAGKSVGAVTTTRVTHATPAAVYAKPAFRDWEDEVREGCANSRDIATQLIAAMKAGTVDIMMGGGSRNFVPEGTKTPNGGDGHRKDGKNLIEEAEAAGIQIAHDKTGLEAFANDKPMLGLWADSHASYEADRPETEPSLVDMTKKAIEALSANENGYYLEVEAGRVDHANHDGNAKRAMIDGKMFADAIALADEMTDDADTLIIVTADHAHTLNMSGYCGRGTPIEGLCYEVASKGIAHSDELALADDGKPYSVVGYLNGTGSILKESNGNYVAAEGRATLTQEEASDIDFVQQSLLPMPSETHSGADVALYAKGPWAHLFGGTIEQNVIFHVMSYAVDPK